MQDSLSRSHGYTQRFYAALLVLAFDTSEQNAPAKKKKSEKSGTAQMERNRISCRCPVSDRVLSRHLAVRASKRSLSPPDAPRVPRGGAGIRALCAAQGPRSGSYEEPDRQVLKER